jgi:hypothetical protein
VKSAEDAIRQHTGDVAWAQRELVRVEKAAEHPPMDDLDHVWVLGQFRRTPALFAPFLAAQAAAQPGTFHDHG